MSLRSLVSRLFSSRSSQHADDGLNRHGIKHKTLKANQPPKWRRRIIQAFIAMMLILSAVWLLLAICYHFGIVSPITWLTAIVVVGLLSALFTVQYLPDFFAKLHNKATDKTTENTISHADSNSADSNSAAHHRLSNRKLGHAKWLTAMYAAVWLTGLGWFFAIEPKQERNWMAEVRQQVAYERDAINPDLITLTHVRNFDWYTDKDATERWETRTVDLSKLSGVDVTNSYWMGPLIAHTLVSFRFEDDRPLAFSFEIRKEENESFSALAGFFRRYELSLIAAEERDIIYTRSNVRGEQVYLFPVSNLQQHEVKSLFESYLSAADELNAAPAWYNTLLSNCTNIIFYMARIVSGDRLPWDYRIWVSGWLPNYLYDVGMLYANPKQDGQRWSMDTWYERTHINPKVRGFNNQIDVASGMNGRAFSQQIRQGIPMPALAHSKADAEAQAESASHVAE